MVLTDSDLKFSSHIDIIVTKAHQRASLILRCFNVGTLICYFRFLLLNRPLLEFNCQVWSPSYSMLVNKIERVQRKFTKRLRGLSRLTYTERLHSLGADSL